MLLSQRLTLAVYLSYWHLSEQLETTQLVSLAPSVELPPRYETVMMLR